MRHRPLAGCRAHLDSDCADEKVAKLNANAITIVLAMERSSLFAPYHASMLLGVFLVWGKGAGHEVFRELKKKTTPMRASPVCGREEQISSFTKPGLYRKSLALPCGRAYH
jgi:hypothetical protein